MLNNKEEIIREFSKKDGRKKVYRIELVILNFHFIFEVVLWKKGEGKVKYTEIIEKDKRYCQLVVSCCRLPVLLPFGHFHCMDESRIYFSPPYTSSEELFINIECIEEKLKTKRGIKEFLFSDILLRNSFVSECIICFEDTGNQ